MLNTSGTSKDGLIVANGNVEIGTASPGNNARVTISSPNFNTAVLHWKVAGNNPTGFLGVRSGNHALIGATGSGGGDLILRTGDRDRMIVKNDRNVGIGTISPKGKLDVNGSIYQRGHRLFADYVFNPGYELETIEEHADFMWTNEHLKAVPGVQKDESGQEIVEIGSQRKGTLKELKKAHVYIQQLNDRIKILEAQMQELGK